jgi:hypothetical protein
MVQILSLRLCSLILWIFSNNSLTTWAEELNVNCSSISDDEQCLLLPEHQQNESTITEFILEEEIVRMVIPFATSNLDSNCEIWAEMGLCNSDTEYMLQHCIPACLNTTILQTHGLLSYGSYNKYRILLKPSLGKSYVQDGIDCVDTFDPTIHLNSDEEGCKAWAERGECFLNPKFMLKRCTKSCFLCIPSGYVVLIVFIHYKSLYFHCISVSLFVDEFYL